MNTNIKKENFYIESSKIFKLLSSPIRLKLINYISFAPRTVDECAKKFDQSVQNISLHLITLSKAKILEVEQFKNFRYYSLSDNRTVHIVATAMAADTSSLMDSELIWEGPFTDLVSSLKNKKYILIDLREEDERNYIPLYNSVPFNRRLSDIGPFLKRLPEKKPLIFVCKGRWCERLAHAVELTLKLNFQVKALCLTAHELKKLNTALCK